jgi:hypothetical protein
VIPLPEPTWRFAAYPELIDAGGVLMPALGGPLQRINRMGSRFRIRVVMPPLRSEADGMVWVARLLRGTTEGVRMLYPLGDFEPGDAGSPLVDGGGQAGLSLLLKGATPGYVFREGQPFNHFDGERYFLYFVAEDTEVDGSGEAELPFFPMLRVGPVDEDVLEFGSPVIEGLPVGNPARWEISASHLIPIEFSIEEIA